MQKTQGKIYSDIIKSTFLEIIAHLNHVNLHNVARVTVSVSKPSRHSLDVEKRVRFAPVYDTRCYFNLRSKANMRQLNLTYFIIK